MHSPNSRRSKKPKKLSSKPENTDEADPLSDATLPLSLSKQSYRILTCYAMNSLNAFVPVVRPVTLKSARNAFAEIFRDSMH